MESRPPLHFPGQRKARAPRKLKPATADCPTCENMLRRRLWVDINGDGTSGIYVNQPAEQCAHKGRPYKINGLLTMVLCVCCANKLMKKSVVKLRTARRKKANG